MSCVRLCFLESRSSLVRKKKHTIDLLAIIITDNLCPTYKVEFNGVFTLGDCSRYRSRECARVSARPVARPLAHRLLDLEELWSRFTGESSPPAPPIAVESPEFVPSPRTRTSTRAEVAQNYSTIGRATIAQHSPSFCPTTRPLLAHSGRAQDE